MRLIVAVFLLCVGQACRCADGAFDIDRSKLESSNEMTSLQATSQVEGEQIVGYLKPILQNSQLVGRMYYSGDCNDDSGNGPKFPIFDLEPPSPNSSGLSVIRKLFRNAPNVGVSASEDGIVRITLGEVSTEFLETKIHALDLDLFSQYDYTRAIWQIEGSAEAKAAAERLGVRRESSLLEMALTDGPEEGRPHLPPSLKNVTLDQALDLVATTFKGIVIYSACNPPKRFAIYFRKL